MLRRSFESPAVSAPRFGALQPGRYLAYARPISHSVASSVAMDGYCRLTAKVCYHSYEPGPWLMGLLYEFGPPPDLELTNSGKLPIPPLRMHVALSI